MPGSKFTSGVDCEEVLVELLVAELHSVCRKGLVEDVEVVQMVVGVG